MIVTGTSSIMKSDYGCLVHKTLGLEAYLLYSQSLLYCYVRRKFSVFQIFLWVSENVEIAWRQFLGCRRFCSISYLELWSLCDFHIFGDLYPESVIFNDSVGLYIVLAQILYIHWEKSFVNMWQILIFFCYPDQKFYSNQIFWLRQ